MAARTPQVLASLLFLLVLAGCGQGTGSPAPAAGGGAPPPPEVGVVTVATGEVGLVTELPGRLEPARVAQVRARAAGIVQERLFREGSDVRAGQVLYRIDPSPYAAAHQSARAALAKAEANFAQASALAQRYKPLAEANAISKQEYANAVAAEKTAEADIASARAAVRTAEINLGYASVTAPISGRIGRSLVTEGRWWGRARPRRWPVIQQIDPLFVNFTQSVSEVMKLRRSLEQGPPQARRRRGRAGARDAGGRHRASAVTAGCCSPTSASTRTRAR
jgi:membrane fusion protein (multidrug efflux system)